MNIPRVSYWDHFYVLEDGTWRLVTPQELVHIYNQLAERYELVLDDIEEIVCGYQRGAEPAIHPGAASTA